MDARGDFAVPASGERLSSACASQPVDGTAPEGAAPEPYQAWLVDLDGTLYDARVIRLVMPAELLLTGFTAIPIIRQFRREHERLRRELHDPVDSPFALQISRTAETLGVTCFEVERRVDEWMVRRPAKWLRRARRQSLLDEILRFRQTGGHTAVVSDYPARHKLRAMGVESLFDAVVANGEPGGPPRLKPHPDGLLAAAAALGVVPERCLVIGDRPDADGAAAKAAGMAFRLIR